MHKRMKLIAIACGTAFVLMIAASALGWLVPPRHASLVLITILSLFFLFGFLVVPLVVFAVLHGNVRLWKALPVEEGSTMQGMRDFVVRNEVCIFHVLVAVLWVIFLLGLAIALPTMIEDGFFQPNAGMLTGGGS
jgi:hypothetical protein